MQTTVTIENLKCEACKDAVLDLIAKSKGISNPNIDIEKGRMTIDYTTHNALEGLRTDLDQLGYPISIDPNVF